MEYRINEDLKIIREMLNMSQAELANDVGLDQKTIARIELGETYPKNENLEKLYSYAYRKNIKLNQIKEMFYKEEYYNKIIFHGSKSSIEGVISPYHGRENNDFGRGFYCGESMEQTTSFIANLLNLKGIKAPNFYNNMRLRQKYWKQFRFLLLLNLLKSI